MWSCFEWFGISAFSWYAAVSIQPGLMEFALAFPARLIAIACVSEMMPPVITACLSLNSIRLLKYTKYFGGKDRKYFDFFVSLHSLINKRKMDIIVRK